MTFGATSPCGCDQVGSIAVPTGLLMAIVGFSGLLLVLWLVTMVVLWPQLQTRLALLNSWRFMSSSTVDKDPVVQEAFQERFLQMWAVMYDHSCVMLIPFMALTICFCPLYTSYFVDEAVFTYLFVVTLFFLFTSVFFVNFRGYLTMTATDVVFSAAFIATAVSPAVASTAWSYDFISCYAQLTLLFISPIFPRLWLLLLLDTLNLGWQMAMIFTNRDPHNVIHKVVLAFTAFSFNVVLGLMTRQVLIMFARAIVETRKASQQAAASEAVVKSLLSKMCDAVVHLRDDLTFKEECPRLMSMLIRSSILTGQTGHSFLNFLCKEDIQRFADFVSESSSSADAASTIHIDLLDCMGGKVRVQVFHTCQRDPVNGATSHLLGLMEDHERSSPKQEAPQSSTPGGQEGRAKTNLRPDAARCGQSEEETSSSAASSRIFEQPSSVQGLSSWGPINGEEAVVTIRTRLHWEVVAETTTSRVFFGFEKDSSPLEFLRRFHDGKAVLRWLEYIHVMACCGRTEHNQMSFGKVSFLTPSSGLEYQAEMHARVKSTPGKAEQDPGPEADMDFDAGLQSVEVELKLRPRQRLRRRHDQSSGRVRRAVGPEPVAAPETEAPPTVKEQL